MISHYEVLKFSFKPPLERNYMRQPSCPRTEEKPFLLNHLLVLTFTASLWNFSCSFWGAVMWGGLGSPNKPKPHNTDELGIKFSSSRAFHKTLPDLLFFGCLFHTVCRVDIDEYCSKSCSTATQINTHTYVDTSRENWRFSLVLYFPL